MLSLISKPIVLTCLTCLICVSLSDCALFVLGPSEISCQNIENDSPVIKREVRSNTLPKRKSKEKQKTVNSSSSANDLDYLGFVEEVPYCTNLFRSSNSAKNIVSSVEAKKNVKIDNTIKFDGQDKIVTKNEDNIIAPKGNDSRIELIKNELSNENEKLRKLTNELDFVKKFYDDSSENYIDYEYQNAYPDYNFVDFFNLINSKHNELEKKKNHEINLSVDKFNGKDDVMLKKNAFTNSDHIKKYSASDNVYQIPNVALNVDKDSKTPTISNNMPVLNPTLGSCSGHSMQNPKLPLQFNHHNKQDEILRKLYPQFFFSDDSSHVLDSIPNEKKVRGRLEPNQVYAYNMKRLTAPYKLFPGKWNPDWSFLRVRDRRNRERKCKRNLLDKRCLKRNNKALKGNLAGSQGCRNDELDQKKFSHKNEIVNLIEDDPSTIVKSTENFDISKSEELKNDNQIMKVAESEKFSSIPDRKQDDAIKLSSSELNNRGLKSDFEARDVDSKAKYFESTNGKRLLHCLKSKDLVEGKNVSDIALEEWPDAKYIPKYELDSGEDKNAIANTEENNAKVFETPDIKEIGATKNLKFTFNNGLNKNTASLKICNKQQSGKEVIKNNFNDFKNDLSTKI